MERWVHRRRKTLLSPEFAHHRHQHRPDARIHVGARRCKNSMQAICLRLHAGFKALHALPLSFQSGIFFLAKDRRTPHLSIPQLHSPFSFSLTSPSFTTMFYFPQFALAILLFPTVALADPIHIPLARRSSGNRGINHYISAAKHLQSKYNTTWKSYSPRGKRASSESIQTINLV
jgi:hypothetical protein